MPRTDFNKAATPKINDYLITMTEMEQDRIQAMVRPYHFKKQLANWVAGETGCVPAIEVDDKTVATSQPQMLIQCTEALMDKIKVQFASEIGEVEHLRKLSDIPPGERNCWKLRP